jgi:3-isopropylmalate dehydrogenase
VSYDIAVLPGDGIGPEVVAEAVRVLQRVCELSGGEVQVELETFEVGAVPWLRTGEAISNEVLAACDVSDAILFGAVGVPDVRHPDGREAGSDALFRLRFELDLFAGIRPIRLYPGVPTPLRDVGPGIDYVIVRENVEGLYAGRPGGSRVEDEVAADTSIVTRRGTTRIALRAFEIASRRSGAPADGVSRVTCVDKANVLASYAFFRRVAEEVATASPDVEFEAIYADAAALYLVQRPYTFDVIAADNMLGDILSDLGAATIGGLGLAPSGDVGQWHGVFQAAHGSAPDLAGQGIANPLATVLSVAMMLAWLGRRDDDEAALRAAGWIEDAVATAIADGSALTRDLGGSVRTANAGDAVLGALDAAVSAE